MKKELIILSMAVFCAGCSVGKEKLEYYVDNPNMLVQDPHFKGYEEQRDILESQYLRKEMTYAEYMEQKRELDNKYDMEVQKRNQHVLPQQ